MNGPAPKIEIVAPLAQAMELMKRILFRPFNVEKWLVIGFAAFLAHLGGGGRFNLNFPSTWQRSHWRPKYFPSEISDQVPGWIWPALFVGVPLGLAIVVLCMLIGARGRLIFTDCVVRNRAAIVGPWHEFRKEGNSLFLFTLGVAVILLGLFAVGLLPLLLPAITHRQGGNITFTLGAVFWIVLLAVAAICWWIISQLMVPVMYRQRCSAWSAFQQVLNLVMSHAVELILFILFYVVLSIALAVLVFIIGVMTCCVGLCLFALPYVGTVILLPLEILLFGYMLLFLRQFGNGFDVWAGAEALPAETAATVPPSTTLPPIVPPEPPSAAPPSSSESPPPQAPPQE